MTPTDPKAAAGRLRDLYGEARRTYGKSSAEALDALSALALDLKQRGEFEVASKYYAMLIGSSLVQLEAGNGQTLLEVLRSGVCYREMGDYTRARIQFLKGVQIAIKFYGLGSDEAVTFASNLVGILDRLEEYEKIPAWSAVAEARLVQRGEDSAGVQNHLRHMAGIFASTGDDDLAERIHARLQNTQDRSM